MSSMNTELLTLYKHPKLYNGSRYKFYQTGRKYDDWLFETSDDSKRIQVNYKSIGEPILLNTPIKRADEYTYGSITNEDKTYYFFVDNIETDAFQKTTINYTIDWWSTNWSKIHCTKAHLTRGQNRPEYQSQPYTPYSTTVKQTPVTEKYLFMATYIPSVEEPTEENPEIVAEQTSYIGQVLLRGNTENVQKISQGIWYNELGLAGSDIKDCFVVPFFQIEDFLGGLYQKPIFIISDSHKTDDTSYPAYNKMGPILNAFIEKYPCSKSKEGDGEYHPEHQADLFDGTELIYNIKVNKYYRPIWKEYHNISHDSVYKWYLEEVTDYDPLQGALAISYYSK